MLGIDSRAARATWTVLLVLLAVALLWLLRETLLLFFFAILLAYLLSPLVELVNRHTSKRFSRTLALAAVYILLLVVIAIAVIGIGGLLVEEAGQLATSLPKLLSDPQQLREIPLPAWLEPYRESAIRTIAERLESGVSSLIPFLSSAGKGIVAFVGNVIHVILVPILSFFFLKDGAAIHQTLMAQVVDSRQRAVLENVFADVHLLLAQFMRALVLLSLATFFIYWIALAILGVPYAVLLSLVAALFEFVPVAGPLVAASFIILVALFSGGGHVVAVLVFLIGYRLFQDYVLQPYLMSSGVAIPPMAVIFAILAGERLAGFAGMFLAIPTVATLRILYIRILEKRQKSQGVPISP